VPARVIVIAGPSGSGKSRLSRRLALPVLNLDDFYKDGGDPSLPRIHLAGGEPIVDWDDPASWLADDAVATIEKLCTGGSADVPVYDIADSRRTGHRVLDLGQADRPAGVVASLASRLRLQADLHGRADHAGTTRREERRDAMSAAARLIVGYGFDPAEVRAFALVHRRRT